MLGNLIISAVSEYLVALSNILRHLPGSASMSKWISTDALNMDALSHKTQFLFIILPAVII